MMSPIHRHKKLHPGSVCKTYLGPQTHCCPLGYFYTNQVPEGLLCSGSLEKADALGYSTYNALLIPGSIRPTENRPHRLCWKL